MRNVNQAVDRELAHAQGRHSRTGRMSVVSGICRGGVRAGMRDLRVDSFFYRMLVYWVARFWVGQKVTLSSG
jgi:hypothetical protein